MPYTTINNPPASRFSPVRRGDSTPWGTAEDVTTVIHNGQSIVRVSTPSHGGYYVPQELLSRIPEEGQKYAEQWSGSRHWYEEDCGWAYVALALPEFFPPDAQPAARATIDYLNQTA